jgi:hypothetical protein
VADPVDPIEVAHSEMCESVSMTLSRSVLAMISAGAKLTQAEIVDVACRSAFSSGLEVGLTIAVTDIAAGRRLQAWIHQNIGGSDPLAKQSRDGMAGELLKVVDR